MKPTVERHRHDRIINYHDTGEAGSIARRVQPPVEVLLVRKTIDQRQYDAACKWRDDYEIGHEGAKDIDGELPPGIRAGSAEGYTLTQLEALHRYQHARRAMARSSRPVAEAVVLHGKTLTMLGRETGKDSRRLTGILDVALSDLADYYRY